LPIRHLCLSKLTYLQSRMSVAHLTWNLLFQSAGRWLQAQHWASHISKPFCLSSGVWQTLATSFISFHRSQITLAPVCLMLWTQSSCLVRHNNNWFCLLSSLLGSSCPSNLCIVLEKNGGRHNIFMCILEAVHRIKGSSAQSNTICLTICVGASSQTCILHGGPYETTFTS
jgi:hypothetical protein